MTKEPKKQHAYSYKAISPSKEGQGTEQAPDSKDWSDPAGMGTQPTKKLP